MMMASPRIALRLRLRQWGLLRPRLDRPAAGVALSEGRSVTTQAYEGKLRERSFGGPNKVLSPSSAEKTSNKVALRENSHGVQPVLLVRATRAVRDLTKARKFQEALRMFRAVEAPDAPLYNAALNVCAKALWHNEAEGLWREMPQEHKSVVSYSTMIDLCRRTRRLREGEALFEEMRRVGVEPSIITCNSMLMLYGMVDQPDRALEFFERLRGTLLPAATVVNQQIAYTAVMTATARAGDYARTRELFVAMTAAGLAPQHAHINALLAACARAGDADTARAVFDSVFPDWGLWPRLEDYTALLGCCRGHLGRCLEILAEMSRQSVQPTGLVFQQVLEAHVLAGDGQGARALLRRPGTGLDTTSPTVKKLAAQIEELPD